MVKYIFFLLIPICLASPVQAMTDSSRNWFTSNTYTHTHQLELKPASLINSYKTASVCFLGVGDCGTDIGFSKSDGFDVNTANQCKNEGFDTTSCTAPEYLSKQCPYNSAYYAECIRDTDRACTEQGYGTSCSGAEIPDPDNVCEYDSKYFGCLCDPCEGFEYSYAQATAAGYSADGECSSCSVKKYKRKCAPCDGYNYTYEEATAEGYVPDGSCKSCETTKYKRKENPCTGFTSCECGGEIGGQTCKSGSTTLYKTCKSCCENKCSETACPAGAICTYEACSGKYCPTGCDINYTDWCNTPVTNCGTLGYTKTPDECEGPYLKCPYGDGVFCKDPCDHIVQVGSFVYADKQVCSNVINNKEPIAVVYDTTLRLAAALEPSSSTMQWGEVDSGNIPTLEDCYTTSDNTYVYRCMTNGKQNTSAILAYGKSSGNTYAAAEFCNTYPVGKLSKGTWFLPSMRELYNLYLNLNEVNRAREQLGLAQLGKDQYKSIYWSSNEFHDYGAWHVQWPSTIPVNTGKYEYRYVLPVMEY